MAANRRTADCRPSPTPTWKERCPPYPYLHISHYSLGTNYILVSPFYAVFHSIIEAIYSEKYLLSIPFALVKDTSSSKICLLVLNFKESKKTIVAALSLSWPFFFFSRVLSIGSSPHLKARFRARRSHGERDEPCQQLLLRMCGIAKQVTD